MDIHILRHRILSQLSIFGHERTLAITLIYALWYVAYESTVAGQSLRALECWMVAVFLIREHIMRITFFTFHQLGNVSCGIKLIALLVIHLISHAVLE